MPITPFHFGPGLAIHSLAPKQVSFIAFCAANVLVDVEPLYYMVSGQFPLHRFFHSYAGVSLVVAITVALVVGALKLAALIRLPNVFRWRELSTRQVVVGAALGGYSHLLLDSIMHTDIRPWAPFSESNALLHAIPLGALHLGCLFLGVAGLVFLGVRKFVGQNVSRSAVSRPPAP